MLCLVIKQLKSDFLTAVTSGKAPNLDFNLLIQYKGVHREVLKVS